MHNGFARGPFAGFGTEDFFLVVTQNMLLTHEGKLVCSKGKNPIFDCSNASNRTNNRDFSYVSIWFMSYNQREYIYIYILSGYNII